MTFGTCQGDRYVLCRKVRQLKILGSCPVTVIYRVTAIHRSALQKSKATENFGKLSGDRNIQGDRYIQVSFAQNIRQLKILESCPVTVIYRVTAIHGSTLHKI